jgi:uncharacterized protein YndB with AHSA1/START domain
MNLIDVNVTRTIPAPAERVYDVWMDASSAGGPWFGCKKVILDARVDGLYYHAVDWQGKEWAHYGRFIALERGRRIEHTWMSEATGGRETVVTVTLEPRGGETLFTLRHTGIPDNELGRGHEAGWNGIADAIAKAAAAKK